MDIPQELVSSVIERGTIFHSTIFENIDHGKFFVIIGENEKEYAGFFFINSTINRYFDNKPHLLELQIMLKKCDYSFLEYDSFLSCTEISTIDKNRLSQSISETKTSIKGKLTDSDTNLILKKVRSSKLFSAMEKETFFK